MRLNKKILLCSLASVFMLTACDFGTLGKGEPLPYDKEESKEKMKDKANTDGFEIRYHVFSENDGEEKMNEDFVLGYKNNIFWSYDDDGHVAYYLDTDNTFYTCAYDETLKVFKYNPGSGVENGKDSFDQCVDSSMTFLFSCYNASTSYVKTGDNVVAGREVEEFTYSLKIFVLTVEYTVSIDKELGICLKFDFTGGVDSTEGSTSGEASYEVKSIKFGNDVIVPNLLSQPLVG